MIYRMTLRCIKCGTEKQRDDHTKRPRFFTRCALCMAPTDHEVISRVQLLERSDHWPWRPHAGRRVEDVILYNPGAVRWACGMLDYERRPAQPLRLSDDALALLNRQPHKVQFDE